MTVSDVVTIVGGGLAGAACAAELGRLGVPCRVLDRGRAPGGRMASPEVHGRRVDLGAGYFTVRDADFAAVVQDWQSRGLVREWTDTFALMSADPHPGAPTSKSGPMRWATPGGLRTVVRDVLTRVDVELRHDVTAVEVVALLDRERDGPVVLAMPDAQASTLVGEVPGVEWVESDAVIAVACGFAERTWELDAGFVGDDPDLTFVADDGSRRGDGAAVLVAHTTTPLARQHLAEPDGVAPVVVTALRRLLGVGEPEWTHAHRWTLAKPASAHETTHHWDGRLGLAGDQWSPGAAPRVESAWRSGVDLARAIAG